MLCCELCGEATECVQKSIDGQEIVTCDQCWCPADQPAGPPPAKTGAPDPELEDFEETLI